MTKEEILEIIYPATAAKYFNVEKTSYLHKQAEEVAEKIFKAQQQNEIKNNSKSNE